MDRCPDTLPAEPLPRGMGPTAALAIAGVAVLELYWCSLGGGWCLCGSDFPVSVRRCQEAIQEFFEGDGKKALARFAGAF